MSWFVWYIVCGLIMATWVMAEKAYNKDEKDVALDTLLAFAVWPFLLCLWIGWNAGLIVKSIAGKK